MVPDVTTFDPPSGKKLNTKVSSPPSGLVFLWRSWRDGGKNSLGLGRLVEPGAPLGGEVSMATVHRGVGSAPSAEVETSAAPAGIPERREELKNVGSPRAPTHGLLTRRRGGLS